VALSVLCELETVFMRKSHTAGEPWTLLGMENRKQKTEVRIAPSSLLADSSVNRNSSLAEN
jgi:hypothetical protein